jgi:hypothetical protein
MAMIAARHAALPPAEDAVAMAGETHDKDTT